MYAVRIISVLLLLAGIFLMIRCADSLLLIAGLACVLIGIVLSRISRPGRRR